MDMKNSSCSAGLDDQLAAYLRDPSRRNLAKVVRLAHAHVWNVARRVTGSHADASDLCQDVFLRLLLNPPAPRSVRSAKGYLSAQVLDMDRRRRRSYERRRKREEKAVCATLSEMETAVDVEALRLAMEELPKRQRTILELKYFAGLKNREIAEVLNLSERGVEDNLRRGREALRKQVSTRTFGAMALLSGSDCVRPPAELLNDLLRVVERGSAIVPKAVAAGALKTVAWMVPGKWILAIVGVILLVTVGVVIHQKSRPLQETSNANVSPLASKSAPVSAGTEKPSPLRPSPGATIRGTVHDSLKRPLSGGTVILRKNSEATASQTKLSADGTFIVTDVEEGEYTLSIDHEVWGELTKALGFITGNRDVNLHYVPRSEIYGEIVAALLRPGEILPHEVNLWIEGPLANLREAKGPEGSRKIDLDLELDNPAFQVGKLAPGVYRIFGKLPKGVVFEHIVEIATNGLRLEIQIDRSSLPCRLFRGCCYLGDRTRPLAETLLNARVLSYGATGALAPYPLQTGTDGTFSCESHRLVAGSKIRLSRGQDLPSVEIAFTTPLGEEDFYEIVFPEANLRQAIVRTQRERPVPYVDVRLRRTTESYQTFQKQTDEHGRFDIQELNSGDYEVWVKPDSGRIRLLDAPRGRFGGQKIHLDDSSGDFVIEVEIRRMLVVRVTAKPENFASSSGGTEGQPAFTIGGMNLVEAGIWNEEQSRAATAFVIDRSRELKGAITARATVTVPGKVPRTLWERKFPMTAVFLKKKSSVLKDIHAGFVISGIPEEGEIYMEILAIDRGWKTASLRVADLDVNPLVEVELGPPPRETEVTVLDRAGRPVDDAMFEVPHHTEWYRLQYGGGVRPGLMDPSPPKPKDINKVNPILGFRHEAPPEKSGPNEWSTLPESTLFPMIIQTAPGKYRLKVYPGADFPILVNSPSAGRRLLNGDALLAEPTIRLEI